MSSVPSVVSELPDLGSCESTAPGPVEEGQLDGLAPKSQEQVLLPLLIDERHARRAAQPRLPRPPLARRTALGWRHRQSPGGINEARTAKQKTS